MNTTIKIKSVSMTQGNLELVEIDGTYMLSFNNTVIMYSKEYKKINNIFDEYLKKLW